MTDSSTENALAGVEFQGVPEDNITTPDRPAFQVGQTVFWSAGSGTVRSLVGHMAVVEDEGGQMHRVSIHRLKGDAFEQDRPEDTRPKHPIYSVREAAKYLGIAHQTVKHHIHNSRRLVPDGDIGGNHYFFEDTLKAHKENRPLDSQSSELEELENPIYSLNEAAKYLGYTKRGFDQVIEDGRLAPDGRIGTYAYFYESTLETYKMRHLAEGITHKKACEMAGKSHYWLTYHRDQGRIQPIGKRGRAFVYDPADIQRLLAEHGDEASSD